MANKTAAEIAEEAQRAKDNPVNRDIDREVEQVRTDATEAYNRNKKRLVDEEANNRANEELANEEAGVSLEEQGTEENIEIEAEQVIVGGPGHQKNELLVEEKKEEIKENPIFKAKTKAEKIAENYKKAVDESTKGIDSNRVLANIGNNGFAAIGMALAVMGSALGSALTGSKGNAAMDAINRIIDNDIAQQKFNRNLKLKKVGALRKDLDKALGEEQKQKTLDGLKRYKYLSAVRSQVEMKMYSTNDPKKKAAYKKQLGLIDTQLTKVYGDFTADVTKFVISEENKQTVAKQTQRNAQIKEQKEKNKRTINFNGRDIVIRTSATPKTINELQIKVNDNNKGNRLIDELKNIIEDVDKSTYTTLELKAKTKPLIAFLKAANRKELIGPGAISEAEWTILNDIVANPTDILSYSKSNLAALNSLKKTLNAGLQDELKGWAEKGTFKDFKKTDQEKGRAPKIGDTKFEKGSKGKKVKWDGKKWVPIKKDGASGDW